MEIKSCKFITSHASAEAYSKESYPAEFCFVGRSNVGKSTLINTLCGAKIARTSSDPGRTRLINIFDCNNGYFTFVDLPGYGYAKAAHTERQSWQQLAEGYFKESKTLKRVFLLCDIRVSSPLDKQMLQYLYYYQLPFSVLATKSDKLSRAESQSAISALAAFLNIGRDDIIVVSHDKTGRDSVLKLIEKVLI